MHDFFEEVDCRSKSDAIVMRLLRSAMDKAHENVQSQNGPIEFIHKRSKFYELAAILVDGGLSIVQEEADLVETSREKMLSDLTEIKDWLQRRIEEMQLLIVEKDKELLEREENELKLRHALELNEGELVYLREKLEFERIRTQDFQDSIPRNQESEGDICELKNSVDQQVLNIKQKLESEHQSSTRRRRASISCISDDELYSQLSENNRHSEFKPGNSSSSLKAGKNNAMVQQMSSEIDILKGTLDLAFGRMQNAEVFPLEKQWKWSIERDILLVSLNGFIIDIQDKFKAEFKMTDCCSSLPLLGFCRGKWKEFVNEIRALHDELKALCSQENQSGMQETTSAPSLQRATSEPLSDLFFEPPDDKDSDLSGTQYVAKLVKNHESFIKKHREHERKRETLRRQASSSIKKEKDPDEMESRIGKAIVVLERLIKWDQDDFRADKNFHNNTNAEASKFQEETANHFLQLYLEGSIREHLYEVYFQGKIKEWNLQMKCNADDCLTEEDICRNVFSEAFKCIENTGESIRNRLEMEIEGSETILANLSCTNHTVPETLGSILKEDIYTMYLRELLKEWRTEKDDSDIELHIREDIYPFFVVEEFLHATLQPSETAERIEFYEEFPSHTELAIPADLDMIRNPAYSSSWHREEVETVITSDQTVKHDEQYDEVTEHDNVGRDLNLMSQKVGISAQQLLKSKAVVANMEHKFCRTTRNSKADEFHRTETDQIEIESEKQHACRQPEQNDDLQQNIPILLPLMEFQQACIDFEHVAHESLDSNCLRVDKLKQEIDALAQPAASMRQKKSLYKKAFTIQSHNLSLAETEVDLLGDQVDSFLSLLQNIYLVLHQNSAVLSQYLWVSDILRWIKKELAEGAGSKPDFATSSLP